MSALGPARPPSGSAHRRTAGRGLRAAGAVAGAVLLVAAGAGAARALWSDSATVDAATGSGSAGFSVEARGSTEVATDPGEMLAVTVGATEAQSLTENGSIALPLVVRSRADGNTGLSYTIEQPAFALGSVFAESTVRLFPVDSAAACTVEAAPASATGTSLAAVGVAAGYGTDRASWTATQYWCLTAVYDPLSDPVSTYTNTGTVTGSYPEDSGQSGTVGDSDSWSIGVTPSPSTTPDPGAEPNASFEFRHTLTRPSSSP